MRRPAIMSLILACVDGLAEAGFGCTTAMADSEHSFVGCDSTLTIDTLGIPVKR